MRAGESEEWPVSSSTSRKRSSRRPAGPQRPMGASRSRTRPRARSWPPCRTSAPRPWPRWPRVRAQKWLMDNAERVVETIVSETGKTYEDAQLAEIGYAGNAFGFWAKMGAEYLADERVKSSQVLVKGKKLLLRYRPLGLIGVIGPWNYPLTNSFGDCIP